MVAVRQTYHEELAFLEQQLLHMGNLTGAMVGAAIESLQTGDISLAEDIIARDDIIDALDVEIESECMRLLALQQPMARDLRQIGTTLKVITDLERVGDHAVDIAKISRKLSQQLFVSQPLIDVGALSEMARRLLQQSLQALIRHDIALAIQICADDDIVDDEFKRLREQLIRLSEHDPRLIEQATYMLLAVAYLERIADHATNIAERVHYVETGEREPLARQHRLDTVTA